ncbi:MAG: betaine-aldehyde dehydrogenase [Pseudomonadota bacterium]
MTDFRSQGRTVSVSAPHYINGKPVDDTGGEPLVTRHPATNEPIAQLTCATDAIIEQAVTAARTAQAGWAEVLAPEKARILNKAAEIVRRRNDEIARVESLDTGKAIQETLYVDAASAADNLEYFGHWVATTTSEHIPLNASSFAYTLREPLGVVGAVGAWNYPIQVASWKASPALAMGNAIIFKPSEETPLSALILAECLTEAGLPDGLFNVIQGKGDVGAKLVNHPGIDKVTLTGSVPTGHKIMAAAANGLKHVSLELGGKSPLIIFDDADVENAVSGAIMANFYSTGQVCSNGTRVYVQSGIREAFIKQLVERTEAIRIGDPLDPDIHMGPMVSRRQLEIVEDYIGKGKAEGGTLLCGGEPVDLEDFPHGHFIRPAIFENVSDDATIAREEIFGPVLTLFDFAEEEDVITRANDSDFGLAAGVFTQNLARAHRVIARLQAGTCYINNFNLTPAGVPFGGYKKSGIGRENAHHAMDYYSQIKSVYVEMGDVEAGY